MKWCFAPAGAGTGVAATAVAGGCRPTRAGVVRFLSCHASHVSLVAALSPYDCTESCENPLRGFPPLSAPLRVLASGETARTLRCRKPCPARVGRNPQATEGRRRPPPCGVIPRPRRSGRRKPTEYREHQYIEYQTSHSRIKSGLRPPWAQKFIQPQPNELEINSGLRPPF